MISIRSLKKTEESLFEIGQDLTKRETAAEMVVTVKNLGLMRDLQPPVQRKNRPMQLESTGKGTRALSPDSQGASYIGGASSPHIKQEYLDTRIKSPSNAMRAKSIQANIAK